MKNVFLIILYFLLIFELISQGPSSNTNDYDYSNYSAIRTNQDLSGVQLESTSSNESVVYVTSKGISITLSQLSKNIEGTADEDIDYGVNAVVLVNGGEVSITGGFIRAGAKGVSGVCATNSGIVTISGVSVVSQNTGSSRGLHATYKGTITASNVQIITNGNSSAPLSTGRGEGTISCTGCRLYPSGLGSPLIYSAGTITVSGSEGTASGAQCIVVEWKNTVIVQDDSNLGCNGYGNRGDVDKCGIFLYQSMSEDAGVGTATFKCTNSRVFISDKSSVYSSAAMFVITNTSAEINLESCTFDYGSKIFLNATKNSVGWGTSGSNGGNVNLTLTNQNIEGDFVIDSGSSLTINMIHSSITGKINTEKVSTNIDVILDSDSSITLTGDSYISSLTDADTTRSNINNQSYILVISNENEDTTVSSTSASSTTVSTAAPSSTSDNSTNPISNDDNSLYSSLGSAMAIIAVISMLLLPLLFCIWV